MTLLRSLWVLTAELYDMAVKGNLTALRKGWNMRLCTTTGCGQVAQVTIRREALEITFDQDAIVKLNEISVPVRKGETVTIPGDDRVVCEDCRNEMVALYGYEWVGFIDRLGLVG